ncbi:AAA family ATPase [Enterococcus quebecensis]|uniref:Nuclease SbcCD subunit C n=1 Tax=Enterococcus quebecensis TaxID=903983 RepID=A0A1E5H3P1_9ENTE|nr:SMC family ATPase [Enterococcus quebecensis]OEG19504.1 exonuclease SbcC [Enterococcus quebecensis]OJG75220.1 exonuclease SbcC [Enterococcus quebecensis]
MKPLTLTLKNFGPYIDETIDFNKFEESSLFLISGKTGSGKTTIFDGMSYALFGESSGKLRQGKEMRSTFADPSEATEVHLAFSHGDHIYEITRKPEQELYKKRGDGTRTQSAKISLIVKDHSGKELREYTKRREVDAFIQELLHLDATQFAQIVLLPQGEFRTFLIANSNDKEKVLRNLFGTQLYQTLNEQLKMQLKTVNKGIEATQQTIKAKLDQLYWQEQPVDELSIDELLALLEQQQKLMQKQQVTEKAELSALQDAKQKKEVEKFGLEELINDFTKQSELNRQKEELDLATEMIENLRVEEQQLQWVKNHQGLLETIDEKSKLIVTYDQELQMNQIEQEEHQQLIRQWENEQQKNIEEAESISKLKEKVTQLQFQLPLYAEKDKVKVTIEKNQSDLEVCTLQLVEIKAKQEEAEQTYQKELIVIERQTKIEKEQLELERHQDQWFTFLENWEQKQRLNSKRMTIKQQLTDREVELEQAQVEKEILYKQVEIKKSEWAKMQISRLSLFLVDGEACPVCGALEHPNKKEHQEFSLEEIQLIENQLNKAEQMVQKQEAVVAKIQAQITQIMDTEQELQEELTIQDKKVGALFEKLQKKQVVTLTEPFTSEGIELVSDDFKERTAEIELELERIESAKHKIIELEKIVKEQKNNVTEKEQILSEKHQELVANQTKIKTITEQLGDDNRSLDDVTTTKEQFEQEIAQWEICKQEIDERLAKLKENQLLLKNSEEHLSKEKATNLTEKNALEQKFTVLLKESNFGLDEKIVRDLLREVPRLEAIKEELTTFDKKKDQLIFQLNELKQKLEHKEQPEITVLLDEIESLKVLIQAKEATYYQHQEKIQANENIQKQVKELIASVEHQWEDITALHQLTATVNGDNPRKTSLERYVLQTYLEKVLNVANQRLDLLTNNRYQFELNQDSGSYKNQTGLEINVYDDNAGSSRSAHTLSGGESFIAALALALSLAEVIQEQAGGVLIEALFIDEGFGSLDEEALEMAMEALETIENEGRMIGIISHVNELKARIPQQLQIKTNGNGQSKVTYQTA